MKWRNTQISAAVELGALNQTRNWGRDRCNSFPGSVPSFCFSRCHFGSGANIRKWRTRVWETKRRDVTQSQLDLCKASWKGNSREKTEEKYQRLRNGKHLRYLIIETSAQALPGVFVCYFIF